MRVLIRLGADLQFVALLVFAFKGKLLSGPSFQDDFQIFLEPAAALGERRVERVMMVWERAPSDSEIQPALADVIQRGDFFSHPNGIIQRKKQHAESTPMLSASSTRVKPCWKVCWSV